MDKLKEILHVLISETDRSYTHWNEYAKSPKSEDLTMYRAGVSFAMKLIADAVFADEIQSGNGKAVARSGRGSNRNESSPKGTEDDAYCVKCKEKRLFDIDAITQTADSGRRIRMGTCSICGTKMMRIIGRA